MPISEFLKASGKRVHAGEAGCVYSNAGKIFISRASVKGVDQNLWAILKAAVDALGIAINCNSIDTGIGQHVPGSRHFDGRAVDVNRAGLVNGVMLAATLKNAQAVRLAEWLIWHGLTPGHESGPHAAVLFGPCGHKWNATSLDHSTHLHVSCYK